MSFDFKKGPFENFLNLYKEAQIKGVPDANAMALATVNRENKPSVRIVLYKGMIRGGFSFFTNYDGRKAHDIEVNRNVAATFFWPHLDRQVRVEGYVEKVSREESEAYFATRPRLSQLGAWTSNQSEKIESFEFFKKKLNEIEIQFKGKSVPCPLHWGGYRIETQEIEFWFGKTGRLHERYIYQKVPGVPGPVPGVPGPVSPLEEQSCNWNKFLRSP